MSTRRTCCRCSLLRTATELLLPPRRTLRTHGHRASRRWVMGICVVLRAIYNSNNNSYSYISTWLSAFCFICSKYLHLERQHPPALGTGYFVETCCCYRHCLPFASEGFWLLRGSWPLRVILLALYTWSAPLLENMTSMRMAYLVPAVNASPAW